MTLTGTVTHRVVWNRTKCKILIGVNRTNMQIEATRGWRLQFGRNRIFGKGGRWPHAQTHAGLVCVCGERRASAAAIKLHVVRWRQTDADKMRTVGRVDRPTTKKWMVDVIITCTKANNIQRLCVSVKTFCVQIAKISGSGRLLKVKYLTVSLT